MSDDRDQKPGISRREFLKISSIAASAPLVVGPTVLKVAGQDVEATERARSYFTGYRPSSPSLALFREGKLVHMMQRSDIEHRDSADIANELKKVFDQHC